MLNDIVSCGLRPCEESVIFNTYHEEITFERKQALASSKKLSSFSLPAGDYQLPFEITLDGHLFETIVGPRHQYHSYELIYNPVVLEMDDIWMSTPRSIEKQWDNKVHYRISIPETNIPFGSTFPVQFFLAPLSKDLRLGAVTIQVVEKHELKIRASAAYSVQYNVHFLTSTREHLVLSERYDSSDDYATREGAFEIEWTAEKQVCLPDTLDTVTQQVKTPNINIYHVLAFTIELRGASGGLSTIKGTIPINIVMSPLVIGENGTVHGLDLGKPQYDPSFPPPLYEDHKTDLLLLDRYFDPAACNEGSINIPRGVGHIYDETRCEFAPSYETIMGGFMAS
ncbi:hypothetical protein ATEIFO6365_0011030000 [Aspergillus terreus]|uniref:Uncharacterized protein n=1 Tax=Aspergillus terreus TaxID=33178 RepID=A0A5M3Z369_ASPTE|nr:hypothetical protein ATETN484_0006030000 [Aspergillus terreus]GFF20040.1 hypothetical protein ATEIFO6365_0011030000 [Aspergillus terreus]